MLGIHPPVFLHDFRRGGVMIIIPIPIENGSYLHGHLRIAPITASLAHTTRTRYFFLCILLARHDHLQTQGNTRQQICFLFFALYLQQNYICSLIDCAGRRQGTSRQGTSRQGTSRQGKEGQDRTGQDRTGQDVKRARFAMTVPLKRYSSVLA